MSPPNQIQACGRHAAIELRVAALEDRPDTTLLLPELTRLRTVAHEAKAAAKAAQDASESSREIAREIFDQFGELKATVDRLVEWRDDEKVSEIAELRRALETKVRAEVLEAELKSSRESMHEITLEEAKAGLGERGERRKFRYALVLALVGAVASGVIGGRLTAHPSCSRVEVAK